MSIICLVHGSTHDANCWELLAPEVDKLGHSVLRSQLPTDKPEAGGSRLRLRDFGNRFPRDTFELTSNRPITLYRERCTISSANLCRHCVRPLGYNSP